MPLELQKAVTAIVVKILQAGVADTPPWLMRPGKPECGDRWRLVREIYTSLTGGGDLPETMPRKERRIVDCVLVVDGKMRIFEVDEKQHFNHFRALTLEHYASEIPLAFPADEWVATSEAKRTLEGGGFAKPRPPLFPASGGRHQQRAFRDALADILPIEHAWQPTLRIADFEVKDWVFGPAAQEKMGKLLMDRL